MGLLYTCAGIYFQAIEGMPVKKFTCGVMMIGHNKFRFGFLFHTGGKAGLGL